MYLTKHHGLGNDFLVTFVDGVPDDAADLAVALCDRRTGIGADGLIFGIDGGSVPVMHLFNSDGSSAEISGNGLRCFAHAVAMRRQVTQLDIDVDTASGRRACSITPTEDPAVVIGTTDMGPVDAGDAPDSDGFLDGISGVDASRWATGAVGNPHVVIEVADPADVDLAAVGPRIERHFPHGVNAHFVRAIADDRIELAVWERGAGITQACGSGATVAAQRMAEWAVVASPVHVDMPGGTATVETMGSGRSTATLTGPATYVGVVQVPRG